MRRRITSFISLLPLVILISLPCPVKQDLKQLLGIPINTSAQTAKNNNTVGVYTSKNKEREQKRQKSKNQHLFNHVSLPFFVSSDVILYQSTGSDPGEPSSIPIFLKYRKLII